MGVAMKVAMKVALEAVFKNVTTEPTDMDISLKLYIYKLLFRKNAKETVYI